MAKRNAVTHRPPVADAPTDRQPVAGAPTDRQPVAGLPAETRPELPAGLRQYLEQSAGLEVNFRDPAQAWAVVDHARHMTARGAILAGYALCWLKASLPEGEWLAGLAQRRMVERTARLHAAVFRFSCRLAQMNAVGALADLGVRRLLSFQDWTDEEISALLAGQEVRGLTYGEAATTPADALEKRQREWRLKDDRIAALEDERNKALNRAETAEAELKRQEDQDSSPRLTKLDAFRRRTRLAAHGYTELAQRTAGSLAGLVHELCAPTALPQGADEVLADKAACTALVLEIRAAKAAMDEAYTSALDHLQGRISTRPDDIPVMTKAEAADARRRRAIMAEFTQAELEAAEALAYVRNEMDGANERGAPPKAVKNIRKKGR